VSLVLLLVLGAAGIAVAAEALRRELRQSR
jgi:hypothetical protein